MDDTDLLLMGLEREKRKGNEKDREREIEKMRNGERTRQAKRVTDKESGRE